MTGAPPQGPVAHSDLWKKIVALLEAYSSHVTVCHVPSHLGLEENDIVDGLANKGRLRSPCGLRINFC